MSYESEAARFRPPTASPIGSITKVALGRSELTSEGATAVADPFRHAVGPGTLTRVAFEPDATLPWLDRGVPWDNFQMQSLGASPDELPGAYYIADYDLWQRSRLLSESLHKLFTDTAKRLILESESERGALVLERQFDIPRGLHAALRTSIATPCMIGRFDIGFDGNALKVFEYNADSSGALLETVETQDKIAAHYKFSAVGQSAGVQMPTKLAAYWSDLAKQPRVRPSHGLVHFMVDDDPEERYTALCMMQAAKAAKFRTQMCVNFADFKFADDGSNTIIDLNGNVVQCVWKTWSWDTCIREFNSRAEQQQAPVSGSSTTATASATPSAQGSAGPRRVQLTDIMFHPNIAVLEPFWKYVTASKALLPYVFQAEPKNEFLLPAFYEKDASIEHAYVRKPVSGRTGANITIHDETSEANAPDFATSGKWEHGTFIYQKKHNIGNAEGYFPICCAWVVGSQFGGMIVRESTTPVTRLESPVAPLRIVRHS
ncbi:MAG TPA: glutathionylspermidine synthase family protein [Chloroflexota bacterium]